MGGKITLHVRQSARILACLLLFASFSLVNVQANPPGAPSEQSQAGRKITGKVVDTNGEPVIGAGVLLKGTTSVGTATDVDGSFSLTVPAGSVLVVTSIGFLDQEVTVGNASVLNVVLEPDVNTLEKVVVVGYGTKKISALTTAVATIDDEEVKTTVHTSLAQRLQGKVPGLQIRQNSGAPGEYDAMINIRGFGTPLIIVDGVIRLSTADFQKLNPEDIESISVLKDGAAAVYGMNAANGVILITTKRGAKGRAKFTYDGSMTLASPTNIPKMSNAYQLISMTNDSQVNMGLNPIYTPEEVENWRLGGEGYESIDWYDLVMKENALSQQHTLSASGGTDAVNYYVSVGYLTDPGLLRNNSVDYDKYTFRSNLTAKVAPNLKAEFDLSGFYEANDKPNHSFFDIIRGTVGEQPMHHPYANDNPAYLAYVYDGQVLNPLALADPEVSGYYRSTNKSFKATGTLTYEVPFVKGLAIKGIAFYEHGNSTSKSLVKAYRLYDYNSDNDTYTFTTEQSPTNLNLGSSDGNGLMFSAQLLYDRTFAEKHHVSATAVYEQRNGWSSSMGAARDFSVYLLDQLNFGDSEGQRTSAGESESGFKSVIGRLAYDYKDKYFLEYAFRYDGSYRYHPDYRWGFFPVYSAGWRISEEPFIKDNVPFLSNLKLRASYGKVGEDAGSAFQYVGGFSLNSGGYEFTNGSWTAGAKAPGLTNDALSWYTSTIMNAGLDLGFFNNELNFALDIYRRNRSGLLATRGAALPNTFGANLPQENLNKDRTDGLDFAVSYNKRINYDWGVNASANFNFARTKTIYVEQADFTNSMNKWRGGTIGRWNDVVWMYQYAGQFQDEEDVLNSPIQDGTLGNARELPGDFKYADLNNDGVIDGNDVVPLTWSGTPKMFYGLTLGANWKNLDFSMLWQGSAKYTVRFTHYYATMFWNNANMPAYFYDRWHHSDPFDATSEWVPGAWPASRQQSDVGAMYSESDRWRKDASYLRLKSISLGYSLPHRWINRVGIQNLRVAVSGYNLLTICNDFVKPFDPEKIEGAYSAGWVYPLTRSFNLNLNVTF